LSPTVAFKWMQTITRSIHILYLTGCIQMEKYSTYFINMLRVYTSGVSLLVQPFQPPMFYTPNHSLFITYYVTGVNPCPATIKKNTPLC
jgi:hypothetical protein